MMRQFTNSIVAICFVLLAALPVMGFQEVETIETAQGLVNIYYVEAGTDQVEAAVDAANSGDIIELVTSGGLYLETSSVNLEDKSLTVRARRGLDEKPVIKNDDAGDANGVFRLKAGSSLNLQGVEFQHAKYLVRVDNDSTADAVLKIQDCVGHTAKEVFVKVYAGAWLDSLIVKNSIFRDCEKNGFYMKEANTVGYAEFENVTIVKAGREAIIIQDNPNAVLRVNHCTFDSISWNDDRRVVYPRDVLDVEIKNSIFTNQLGDPEPHSDAVRVFGNSSVHHCNFYNAGGVDLEDTATLSDTLRQDPLYTDPTTFDYTLMETSPVLGQADDGLAMGDLRWDPHFYRPKVHYVEAGVDQLNDAVDQASSGDIIELVTSGGLYLETSSVNLDDKKLTIRAREGLAQKPVIKNEDAGDSNGVFRLKAGSSLNLQGVEFQHAKYLVRVDNDSTADAVLKIQDCVGHTAKEVFVKVYSGAWLDSLIVKNSIFRDCEKNGFYMKEANTVGYAEFENVTIVKAGREAIIIQDNPNAVLRVNHCTFDSISWNDDRRVVYPRDVLDVEIKNSIFTNQLGVPEPHSDAVRVFGNSSVHHCNFYNAGGVDLEDTATLSDTLRQDPLYYNPAEFDYRLAEASPCREAADDGRAMGDLRWEVSPDQYFLTIVTNGKGIVDLDPAGGVYAPGTEVTLTAQADYGWGFDGWSGDITVFPPDQNPTTVAMDANKTIEATFINLKPRFPVNITTVGVGHIEFDPLPDDEGLFEEGTDVTLTAVSDTTSMEFEGWSGDVTRTDNPIQVTVEDTVDLQATFVPVVPQVALNVSIEGKGSVDFDPEAYEDYGTYDSSTVVTLTAQSVPGWQFDGWSGDVTSTESPLTVVMDADKELTATFSEVLVEGGSIEVDTTWDFRKAVEFANNNSSVDSLILITSGGLYTTQSSDPVAVRSSLTITAPIDLEKRPVITNSDITGGRLEIIRVAEEIEEFRIENVILDGGHEQSHGMKYAITLDDVKGNEETVYGKPDIIIDNCYFKNIYQDKDLNKDGHAVKYYKYCASGVLKIENCMFNGTGYEAIRISETEKWPTDRAVDSLIIRNCSFTNIDAECVRYYSDSDPATEDAPVLIEHVTVNHSATRWLYLKNSGGAIVRDIIIANTIPSGHGRDDFLMDAQGNEGAPSFTSHIDTFQVANVDIRSTDAEADTTTIWGIDPKFKDPDNLDYTLLPESHLYGLAHDDEALGDLNWATNEPVHVTLSVVVEGEGEVLVDPAPVGKTYDPDQEVTLTAVPDSGHKFVEWSGDLSGSENPVTLKLDKSMTVTATFEEVEALVEEELPTEYSLSQNYPNPFNPSTTIKFALKAPGHTTVKVFDILGREVATLIDKEMAAGRYDIEFHNVTLSSGVYFYTIKSGEFTSTKKMILMK